ncbi:MAG: RHS repeat-associated core domain-containing protein, partial [Lachnospiraceae bacterium]|nr:RHS repeat-associated core domain-containing protein [Lachnospiraceae bacterium]
MKKTIGSTDEYYMYTGGRLTGVSGNGKEMYFSYDSIGNPVAVMYNGNEYYYVKNIQSDIIGLVDGSGTWVVEYSYDAWGRVLSVTGTMAMTIGQDNPLRYRGYFYDVESGFYYVSSRYYDPGVGRFISADTTDILGVDSDLYDKNLYAYCDNNPVMRKDLNGQVWITVGIMAVGGIIGGVIGAVSSAVTQNALTGTINWKSVAVAGGAGFVSGAVAASPLGLGWQMGIGAGIGAASYLADCGVNKKSVAVDELIVATAGGLASGYIGGPGANQHMALTRTIQTSIKTTTRMSTRKATTYAAK